MDPQEMSNGQQRGDRREPAASTAPPAILPPAARRLRDEAMASSWWAPGRAHDGTHDGTHGPPVPAPVPAWKDGSDPRDPVHGGFASPAEGQGDQTVSNQTVISSPPCPAQPILSRRCLAQVHWKPGCCPRRRLNLMMKDKVDSVPLREATRWRIVARGNITGIKPGERPNKGIRPVSRFQFCIRDAGALSLSLAWTGLGSLSCPRLLAMSQGFHFVFCLPQSALSSFSLNAPGRLSLWLTTKHGIGCWSFKTPGQAFCRVAWFLGQCAF